MSGQQNIALPEIFQAYLLYILYEYLSYGGNLAAGRSNDFMMLIEIIKIYHCSSLRG